MNFPTEIPVPLVLHNQARNINTSGLLQDTLISLSQAAALIPMQAMSTFIRGFEKEGNRPVLRDSVGVDTFRIGEFIQGKDISDSYVKLVSCGDILRGPRASVKDGGDMLPLASPENKPLQAVELDCCGIGVGRLHFEELLDDRQVGRAAKLEAAVAGAREAQPKASSIEPEGVLVWDSRGGVGGSSARGGGPGHGRRLESLHLAVALVCNGRASLSGDCVLLSAGSGLS